MPTGRDQDVRTARWRVYVDTDRQDLGGNSGDIPERWPNEERFQSELIRLVQELPAAEAIHVG
jgi:hypothetical protein